MKLADITPDMINGWSKNKLIRIDSNKDYSIIRYNKRVPPGQFIDLFNPLIISNDYRRILAVGIPRVLSYKFYDGSKIVRFTEKIDGTKVLIKNTTQGIIVGYCTDLKNIREYVIRDQLESLYYSKDTLDKDVTYICEMCNRDMPLILQYNYNNFYLIDKLDNSLNSVKPTTRDLGLFKTLPDLPMLTIEEAINYVNGNKNCIEGVVFQCADGKRYKIISEEFLRLKSLINLNTRKEVERLILSGKINRTNIKNEFDKYPKFIVPYLYECFDLSTSIKEIISI
jgi:hypothetical protein